MGESYLNLGWRVDGEGHPLYWMRPDARAGGHSEGDLVRIPSRLAAKHTAVIAQSGSGKSYFLGRLVEEILLNTRAKVMILDPNADFRNYHSLDPGAWTRSGYDPERALGSLPTEQGFGPVDAAWQAIPKRVGRGDLSQAVGSSVPMQIWWPLLTMGLFAEELGPAEGVGLRHCHTFVQSLETLLGAGDADEAAAARSNVLLEKAQAILFRLVESRSAHANRDALRSQLAEMVGAKKDVPGTDHALDRAVMAVQYVSRDVAQFYFARAGECEIAGILRQAPPPDWEAFRSLAFDLPSLPNPEMRLLVVYQVLARLWASQRKAWQKAVESGDKEDQRVPVFVVVDEAHNLLPAEPQSRAAEVVREVFRTIAAEGRKFGLFLIVVSQRPDKLDRMILSECENKIVMRIDAPEVLGKIRDVLGVSGAAADQLADCLSFRTGRALLFGSWATAGPVKFMSAARRTVEGGRNLNARWWAQPAAAH
jgi:hypothetical protein